MKLAMGQHIDGGRVLANWPDLEPEPLFEERDVYVTIDYRDILAQILQKRPGNGNIAAGFPDFRPAPRAVTI